MLIKSVILFLLVMIVIAMIGNALSPGLVKRQVKKRLGVAKPLVCPHCKRYLIGSTGCDCKKG
jgi:hypothetical protein